MALPKIDTDGWRQQIQAPWAHSYLDRLFVRNASNRTGAMQASYALQERRQVLAVDELHRDEVQVVELRDVMDPADVGMGFCRAIRTSA